MRLSNLFDWYLLQTLEFEGGQLSEFGNHAHDRFMSKVRDRLAELELDLAETIFNYLTLACAGEARHSGMTGYIIPQLYGVGGRHAACTTIMRYDPVDSLDKLVHLFNDYSWSSAYGGPKWGHLAESALAYKTGKVTRTFFLDHVVDLAHNGGFAFNKREALSIVGLTADISQEWLMQFLSIKTFSKSLLTAELDDWMLSKVSGGVVRLIRQFYALYYGQQELDAKWHACAGRPYEFTPVQWGDWILGDIERKVSDPVRSAAVVHSNERVECYECEYNYPVGDCVMDSGGNYWCQSCFSHSHWQCWHCDEYFSVDWDSWTRVDGNHWCGNCAVTWASYCEYGEHHTYSSDTNNVQGVSLCNDCLYDLPVCDGCGEYVFETREIAGMEYCEDCQDKIHTCFFCEEMDYEKYMYLDEPSGLWVCASDKCMSEYKDDPNALYLASPAKPAQGQIALPYPVGEEVPF